MTRTQEARAAADAGESQRALTIADLLGVWQLVEIREFFSDGAARRSRSEVTGYLTYDAEGTASLVLGSTDRLLLDAGAFEIGADDSTISHEFDAAFHPEWPAVPFVARAHVVDNTLTLRSNPCVLSDGRTLLIRLEWSRL